LQDIAKKVPYLILHSDYGPDFKRHCIKECESLNDLSYYKSILEITKYRKKHGEYEFFLPQKYASSFANGDRFVLAQYFTQFVVCSMDNFSSLLHRIKKVTSNAVRRISKAPKKGWIV
jgi:uncharacterized protein YpbB